MRVTHFFFGTAALLLASCSGASGTAKTAITDPAVKPNFVEVAISPRCVMPRASSNDHIAYIYTYGGGHKTPMAHAYKAEHQTGQEFHVRSDVVVTRTDKPVYLILDSYNALMWNIVVAPGAEVSGISVMSYEGSSVTGVPEGVDVGFLAFRGVANKKCFNRDRGSTVPVEERVKRAAENGYTAKDSDRREWAQDLKDGAEWRNRWVPRTFGGTIDENFYPRVESGHLSYVGPRPETPVQLTPITTVYVPDSVYPAWGTRKEVLAAFDAIARAELDALLN